MNPGESGEGEGGIGGAQEGFCAGLDEGGQGDCEFADAEPAGAAVDVSGEGVICCGLDGQVVGTGRGEHGVFPPFYVLAERLVVVEGFWWTAFLAGKG